ncbi:glycosyl transferase [Actinoplanes philippinensis]|uniref:Glycosyl transferase family 2 n=1 Tax=Actinoplanes philippinensis TaxID=35752 RepID=A0A1I2AGV8_9ACTN|nr:glycosyltransferase family A protein [Actinoplanes philippinensis]GIE74880.1 glycosyl transferase [Actinoplanes philippinensis]SFE43254.1 Glycosyl transferase family 2 [Actinoplanes philippinensis]
MSGLRISVVIPAYNEETMIGACLESVLTQSRAADEVIVVDNNSTDRTAEILHGFRGRVIVLAEGRQGVQHARNRGLNAATGDVIVRIDADTRLPAGHLAAVEETFRDPSVDAATGPVRYYDVTLPRVAARGDAMIRGLWTVPNGRLDWVFGANMAIRRPIWHAVAASLCADERFHEDLDLGMHLRAGGYSVRYARTLVAGTSSRRVKGDFTGFRHYLLMTERGYAQHIGRVRRGSYARAVLTARFLLAMYPMMRWLHTSHHRRHELPMVAARKNPMSSVGDQGIGAGR